MTGVRATVRFSVSILALQDKASKIPGWGSFRGYLLTWLGQLRSKAGQEKKAHSRGPWGKKSRNSFLLFIPSCFLYGQDVSKPD